MKKIKHIWFDFGETIARTNPELHDELKYLNYAAIVGKPVDDALRREYEELLIEHHNSNSDVFYALGKPSGWWSSQIASLDPAELFELIEDDTPQVLQEIKRHVQISIFSNIDQQKTLPALGIDPSWFAHILSSGMVNKPKPALDGFLKMIELSQLEPGEILYIGDHETKDVVPAKEVGIQAGIIYTTSNKADYSFSSFHEILDLVE